MTNNSNDINYIISQLQADPEIQSAISELNNSVAKLISLTSEKLSYKIIHDTVRSQITTAAPAPVIKTQARKRGGPAKRTDWTNAKPTDLRGAYAYRKRTNSPIEPELERALAETFSTYDTTTHKFNGRGGRPKVAKTTKIKANKRVTKQSTPTTQMGMTLPIYSIKTPNNKYVLRFDNGTDHSCLSKAATAPYELCLLDTKSRFAVIRKQCGQNKNILFVFKYNTGNTIPEIKHGIQRVNYDAANHALYTTADNSKSIYYWHLSNGQSPNQTVSLPAKLPEIRANSIKKETIIIDNNGNTTVHPIFVLFDITNCSEQNNKLLELIAASKSVATTPAPEQIIPSKTVAKKSAVFTDELIVEITPIKTTLDGQYNNVFVNGKKILSNHLNTSTEILFDGLLLAIHGTITSDPKFPTTPVWQIYDTDLRSRIPLQRQKFNKYNVYAKQMYTSPDAIRLDMSNRSNVFIKAERIRANATKKRFKMKNQHTK